MHANARTPSTGLSPQAITPSPHTLFSTDHSFSQPTRFPRACLFSGVVAFLL